eukprot:6395596-Pyramimonas_sp.AAC.1
MRDVFHATHDFWLVPAQAPPFVAGLQTGKYYAQEVRNLGKKHKLGPPHAHVATEVLRELHKTMDGTTGSEMERQCQNILGEFINSTANEFGPLMIQEIFTTFKVAETYKKDD